MFTVHLHSVAIIIRRQPKEVKMMKKLAVLSLFVVAVMSQLAHDGDLYDNVDMIELVKSDDLRNGAFLCLMDRGPCTGFELVRYAVPRIMKTECTDCSPAQKAIYLETIKYLEENQSELYKELKGKLA